MRGEGYAAVTSRQLGKVAGLSPQIVYYYFKTMDELFEALFSKLADFFFEAIDEAASADEPMLALWTLSSEPSRAVLITEFVALANHRKGIRTLIQEFGQEFHKRQMAIIATELAKRGVDQAQWSPSVLAALLENTARGFAFGGSLNIVAHDEARAFVTTKLHEFSMMKHTMPRS
jgi:AcrR family transcriptional regulator